MSKKETEKKGAVKEAEKGTIPEQPEGTVETPKKASAKYIWVKLRAYVDEAGEKRIDKGLYLTAEVFPRLERANLGVCEIFEGDIPERKLIEIAKAFGVSTDNKDLLGALLTKNINLF